MGGWGERCYPWGIITGCLTRTGNCSHVKMVRLVQSRYLGIALAYAFILTALQFTGFLFPGSLNWGFHFFGFLPPLFFVVSLAILTAHVVVVVRYDIRRVLAPVQEIMDRRPYVFLVIVVLAFIGTSALVRVQVPLLGDSFYIIKHFADVSRGDSHLDPRNEPLATSIFFLMMRLGGKPAYKELLDAFYYGELILGTILIVLVYFITNRLFDARQPRLLVFLLLLSLPYMQLFFGYIENYSVVLVALALYVLSGILVYQNKLPFHASAIALVLCFLAHYLTILLLPSLLFLSRDCLQRRKYVELSLGVLFLAASSAGLLYSVGWDYAKLLPLTPHHHYLSATTPSELSEATSEAYTLFSPYHLLELLNYAVLMGSAMLCLMGLQLFQRKTYLSGARSREQKFLLFAFLPIMVFLIVAKFDLGAARDWDVFASYFFILAVLTLSMFLDSPPENKEKILAVTLGLCLFGSTGMFVVNASDQPSIARYKVLFDRRITSQFAYYSGSLYLAYYYHQAKENDAVLGVWRTYIDEFPTDRRGYRNMLTNLNAEENIPEQTSILLYEKWLRAIPEDSEAKKEFVDYLRESGEQYFSAGDYVTAKRRFLRAVKVDPENGKLYNGLGSVLVQEGKLKESTELFRRAIVLDPDYPGTYLNLGLVLTNLNEMVKAKECFQIAAELGNIDAQRLLEHNIPHEQIDNEKTVSTNSPEHQFD